MMDPHTPFPRATTHNDHGATSGGRPPRSPDLTQHGKNPELTRREIANAEAQDAALFAKIQFNEESV